MKKTLLMVTLIFWIGLILFLSFQTGADTADTSMGFTTYILQFFIEGDIPYETLMYWHMKFRLWAHPAIFFFYAMLATGVMEEFVKRNSVCCAVSLVSGIILAVFSEVGKWNIPGRHCDVKEMALNVLGVIAGTVLMLIAQLISKKDRNE